MQITLHMHSLVHSGLGFADLIQRRASGQHHCHATFGTPWAGSINTYRSIAHNTPGLKHCINNKKGEKQKFWLAIMWYRSDDCCWNVLLTFKSMALYTEPCVFTLHQYLVIFTLMDCRNHTACYCYKLPSSYIYCKWWIN